MLLSEEYKPLANSDIHYQLRELFQVQRASNIACIITFFRLMPHFFSAFSKVFGLKRLLSQANFLLGKCLFCIEILKGIKYGKFLFLSDNPKGKILLWVNTLAILFNALNKNLTNF